MSFNFLFESEIMRIKFNEARQMKLAIVLKKSIKLMRTSQNIYNFDARRKLSNTATLNQKAGKSIKILPEKKRVADEKKFSYKVTTQ